MNKKIDIYYPYTKSKQKCHCHSKNQRVSLPSSQPFTQHPRSLVLSQSPDLRKGLKDVIG